MTIDDYLGLAPVIPVITIEDGLDPTALAETLVEAGLPVIEVTLRNRAALPAIRAMANVAGAQVGAGTVLNASMLAEALDSGARFIVSPGLTDDLARAAVSAKAAFLPGIATAGDIMRGLDHGFDRFKFFPAEAAGGLPALKALAAPFGEVRFCPTGGITEASAPAWLSLPSVRCVGGSWIVPSGERNLEAIAVRTRKAASLPR